MPLDFVLIACLWICCIICFTSCEKDERQKSALIIALACSASIFLSVFVGSSLPVGDTWQESNAYAFIYHFSCFGFNALAALVVMLYTENTKAVLAIAAISLANIYSLFTLFIGVIYADNGLYLGYIMIMTFVIGLTMFSHGSVNLQPLLDTVYSLRTAVSRAGRMVLSGQSSNQAGP